MTHRTPRVRDEILAPPSQGEVPAEASNARVAGIVPPARSAEGAMQCCLERVARREPAALAELYDATVGSVHAVALRILRNPETAEEVVADVYLQVWRQCARFDAARGNVLTWILVICRSRALDALRRHNGKGGPAGRGLVSAECADEQGDVQEIFEAMQRGTRLHSAIALLSPLHRQLVALAFFRGCSHSEIAASMAMPLGSVKWQIRQALRGMRGAIGEQSRDCLS